MSAVDHGFETAQSREYSGVNWIKACAAFFGVALCLAGVGMWIVPQVEPTASMLLMKFGVTVVEISAGIGFLLIARTET